MPTYLPGYAASITVNGNNVGVSGWDFKDSIDLVDVSDTVVSANGIQGLVACLKRGSASLTFWLNLSQSLISVGLVVGAAITLAVPSTGDSGVFRVKDIAKKMVINGVVGVQVELQQSTI